MKCRRLG